MNSSMSQKLQDRLQDCHLDHVAIAVQNIDMAQKIYQAIGVDFEPEQEIVESQAVRTAFGRLDQRAKLELLEPHGESGPIHRFLEKHGPGIHHLCFRVRDVAAKCEELKGAGLVLVYQAPVKGAHDCLINFIHPKSTGGVLIELSQSLSK